MADKNIIKNSKVTKRYTNGSFSNGFTASTHLYQGWSSNGMKKVNELFVMVKTDRSSENALFYKESFHEFCSYGGITGKKKKIV